MTPFNIRLCRIVRRSRRERGKRERREVRPLLCVVLPLPLSLSPSLVRPFVRWAAREKCVNISQTESLTTRPPSLAADVF